MKKLVLLSAAAVFLFCSAAQAEVFPAKEQTATAKEKAGGTGVGKLYGSFAFFRDKAPATDAIKEIATLTLQPGDSIGVHKHAANEETYVFVSGSGEYTDSDGKLYPVNAGDITVLRKGGTHGLANTGKEPLVFVSVIAAQD